MRPMSLTHVHGTPLILAIAGTSLLAIGGCKSDSSDAPAAASPPAAGSARIVGTIAAPAPIGIGRAHGLKRGGNLACITPLSLPALTMGVAAPTPDRVVAIGSGNTITTGTITAAGTFQIDLAIGQPYFLGFYQGTTFLYAYGYTGSAVDDAGAIDSLPLNGAASGSTIDLGQLTATSTRLEPATDPTTVLNLGTAERSIVARFDRLLWRFSNIDVDNDGIFDITQARYYDLYANFNYTYTSGRTAVAAGLLDPDSFSLQGYMFYAPVQRADLPVDPSSAENFLGGPVATITIPGFAPGTGLNEDYYQRYDGDHAWFYNFSGDAAATIPGGDYVVRLFARQRIQNRQSGHDSTTEDAYSTAIAGSPAWATTLTYKNMPTASIGGAQSAPKLLFRVNLSGDAITSVDYAWKIYEGSAWRAMTLAEVRAYMSADYVREGLGAFEFDTGATTIMLDVPNTAATGTMTAAQIRGGAAFPAWSAVVSMHGSWVDFTGTSFGIDLH